MKNPKNGAVQAIGATPQIEPGIHGFSLTMALHHIIHCLRLKEGLHQLFLTWH